jgi:hypothetical protein
MSRRLTPGNCSSRHLRRVDHRLRAEYLFHGVDVVNVVCVLGNARDETVPAAVYADVLASASSATRSRSSTRPSSADTTNCWTTQRRTFMHSVSRARLPGAPPPTIPRSSPPIPSATDRWTPLLCAGRWPVPMRPAASGPRPQGPTPGCWCDRRRRRPDRRPVRHPQPGPVNPRVNSSGWSPLDTGGRSADAVATPTQVSRLSPPVPRSTASPLTAGSGVRPVIPRHPGLEVAIVGGTRGRPNDMM